MRARVAQAAEDAGVAFRFLPGLPRFLRTPPGLDEAREVLRTRWERRETAFLELAADPAPPYARLLRRAGCEHEDIVRLVRVDGLEGRLYPRRRSGS